MRIDYSTFSRKSREKANSRIRLIEPPQSVAKVSYKRIFWTIPFLIRIWDRINELMEDDPSLALDFAKHAVDVAERIEIATPSHCYNEDSERQDFIAVSRAVYSSALGQVGQPKAAKREINQALASVSKRERDPWARAEVLRRAAWLAVDFQEYAAALDLAESAAEIFRELEDHGSLALCFNHSAHALYCQERYREASVNFAQALYWGAKSPTGRGKRAIVAAASNLACCALKDPTVFPAEIAEWARAAREVLKGKPSNLPKLKVEWVEALACHRLGLGRYAATRLLSVRKRLLKIGAYFDAAVCTADLIAVVNEHESEDAVQAVIEESVRAFREATPEEAESLVEKWILSPGVTTVSARSRQGQS